MHLNTASLVYSGERSKDSLGDDEDDEDNEDDG
jgi:hypothetical protein